MMRPVLRVVPAHHGDIVLRVAAHDAGVAADAGVHVDGHAPGVFVVAPVAEHAGVRIWIFRNILPFMGEVGVLLELVQRGVANDAARHSLVAFERMVARTISTRFDGAVIRVVALGYRELIRLAGLLHGRARGKQQARWSCESRTH